MKITLQNISVSNSIIEQNKVRWNIHFKKIKRAYFIFGGLLIVFLITGICTANDYSMIRTGVSTETYFNLNLFSSIGIAGSVVLLYVIWQVSKSRKAFFNAAADIARKFGHVTELHIELTDTELIIDRKLVYEKINWQLLTNKIYHGPFILLIFSNNPRDGVIIDERWFSESELQIMKELIDQKIK